MAESKHNPFRHGVRPPHWQSSKYDHSGNLLLYAGFSLRPSASTSDEIWWIYKFIYDVDENLIDMLGPIFGSWDNRTSLGW